MVVMATVVNVANLVIHGDSGGGRIGRLRGDGGSGGGTAGICDSGYPCAYPRNISWADETTPLPKLVSPRVVFERLFSGFDSAYSAVERERREARLSRRLFIDPPSFLTI